MGMATVRLVTWKDPSGTWHEVDAWHHVCFTEPRLQEQGEDPEVVRGLCRQMSLSFEPAWRLCFCRTLHAPPLPSPLARSWRPPSFVARGPLHTHPSGAATSSGPQTLPSRVSAVYWFLWVHSCPGCQLSLSTLVTCSFFFHPPRCLFLLPHFIHPWQALGLCGWPLKPCQPISGGHFAYVAGQELSWGADHHQVAPAQTLE